ncbi:hypothetical protein DCE93_13365 [Agromyces badenianii]|uniref:Glutaminase n=1 Tax=Agromyces badenianii TaxID=2080742 RepID=A0A2S0WYX8_9MICO|nr:hypothetical protein [Agromyces badenianii]AWB96511.1 hypothetical protein DCE93_13365 [Agromyces badenianii]
MTDAGEGAGGADADRGADAADGAGAAGAAHAVGALVVDAVARLREHSARDEVLADYVPERRTLGIPRAARMAPIGRVWRLGVLLLAPDGRLSATGRVVRAEREARRSTPAAAIAEQRAYRAAAIKGGIAEGETVNFDTVPIDLAELGRAAASGPLVVVGDEVFVRWSPTQPDALTALDRYLADRVELLANPPSGA